MRQWANIPRVFCQKHSEGQLPPTQPPLRQQTFPQQPPPPRNNYHNQPDPDPEPCEYTGRPTSSVYSQPSFSYSQPSSLHTSLTNHRDRVNLRRYHPGGFDDVSPPSSPELPDDGNVYVLLFLRWMEGAMG